jgi:hypothetical protein
LVLGLFLLFLTVGISIVAKLQIPFDFDSKLGDLPVKVSLPGMLSCRPLCFCGHFTFLLFPWLREKKKYICIYIYKITTKMEVGPI